MKLTKKNLIELIELKNKGWTSYQVKKKVNVSVRRIDQIYKKYLKTGEIPNLGKKGWKTKKRANKKRNSDCKKII